MAADPTNLDPHVTVDGLALSTMQRGYDKLVDLRPGEPKPGRPARESILRPPTPGRSARTA